MHIVLKRGARGLGFLLLGLGILISALSPASAASNWSDYGQGRIRLITATDGTSGEGLRLGLHYDIEPGWEIYWRSPGEAGFPTTIDWDGSENFTDPILSWPAPDRFQIFGLDTFGYQDEVVLLIDGRITNPNQSTHIEAHVNFLTCQEVCIPHDITLSLDLDPDSRVSDDAQIINQYWSQVPTTDQRAGFDITRSEFVQVGKQSLIQVVATSAVAFEAPDIIIEGPNAYVFAPPEVRLTNDGQRAVFQVPVLLAALQPEGGPPPLLGTNLTLTLVDGDRAFEQVATIVLGQAEAASFLPLVVILLLALAGGMILNVMPCVLPVLSIKLMGVINHGGGNRSEVRGSFLGTSAGIIFAFLMLATALVALKQAGATIGWGIQFQQPLFIIVMAVLITLFAGNMWGFFEFALPQWVSGFAAKDRGAANPNGFASSFGTGIFATILATPCSAPFLGTALGFALARGPVEIYSIFAALGVGMALPYLAASVFPGFVTRLPGPGPWMLVVKKIMGFALAATAIWLLSILSFQVGLLGAGLVAALLVGSLLLLWARRWSGVASKRFVPAIVTVFAVLTFGVPSLVARTPSLGSDNAEYWKSFDPAAIDGLVRDGYTVFVDVTAEWCVTCLVNKKLVLDRRGIREILSRDDVVAMQADWTSPNEAIASFLAEHNRFGIPFNIIYGPQTPNGFVLPELLSERSVLEGFGVAANITLAGGNR